MITIIRIFIILVIFAFSAKADEKQINNILDQYRNCHGFNGTILVAADDKIILQKAFGFANKETRQYNKVNTRFPIGSISKQFTAVTVLMLVEQGKISLNSYISDYLPNLPKWSQEITIHHLLNHSSGLPDYITPGNFLTIYHTPSELIKLALRKPLKFPPGKSFSYSNLNYVLLGMVIEKISGVKLEKYIKNNILQVAGMQSSFLVPKGTIKTIIEQEDNISSCYKIDSKTNNLIYVPSIDLSNGFGAGSIISNVVDLHKWNQALYSKKIISKESIKKLTNTYYFDEKHNSYYGYGMQIIKLANKEDFYYHGGRWRGFTGILAYIPKKKITIAILTNLTDENKVPLIVKLAKDIGYTMIH